MREKNPIVGETASIIGSKNVAYRATWHARAVKDVRVSVKIGNITRTWTIPERDILKGESQNGK